MHGGKLHAYTSKKAKTQSPINEIKQKHQDECCSLLFCRFKEMMLMFEFEKAFATNIMHPTIGRQGMIKATGKVSHLKQRNSASCLTLDHRRHTLYKSKTLFFCNQLRIHRVCISCPDEELLQYSWVVVYSI